MFDLTICKETNDFLSKIRQSLKNNGYNKKISKCNRYIGTIHLNYIYEYYTKENGKIMFEIERDLENNVISTKLHFKDDNGKLCYKNIRLADIKDLA